ncbi:hypothetical protein M378DRAFT_14842 [Amanita muscaria Koide BX008]|uniref:Uncharacterized protein n=1 Tax=Amanita muscaria (strain Koide BX008) TaxID=946122 RepID=A0A0C2S9D9_AMAMK|nr:hypothetical protein M378DRAFT_14842 [Amanita muscaria Koide BX008]
MSGPPFGRLTLPRMSITEEEEVLLPGSSDVLLNGRTEDGIYSTRFCNWNAHSYWLIPVVLTVYMSRGATMAPRIQVYKAIACRSLSDGSSHNRVSLQMFMNCSGSDAAARAAKIQANVTTIMNILSSVTTGFWSRLGDAYGRKPIFIMYLIGAIFMESVFVLVMRPNTIFSNYSEHFILLGPIVEGFLGAAPTFVGLLHAYISDCTRHGSRSKEFSTIHGIIFIGLSIGPWLAGIILPPDAGSDSFFYISMTLLAITVLYTVAVLPESLRRTADGDSNHRANEGQIKPSTLVLLRRYFLKFLAAMVSSIVMFAPRPIKCHPRKKTYMLTFLGLAVFIYTVACGLFGTRYVFAQQLYSWTTSQLGYYMSLLWLVKAVNLLVILPIVISYLKPKTSVAPGVSLKPWEIEAELRFDKQLALASLALGSALDLLVALTSRNSQAIFIVLSCASSFTSGVSPAFHSLGAVCLHACGYSSEVGTLFGAKAVLSAVAHIISPSIFATTYAKTVGYFPQAIYVLSAVLTFTSALFIAGIRPSLKEIEMVHATNPEGLSPSEEESLSLIQSPGR